MGHAEHGAGQRASSTLTVSVALCTCNGAQYLPEQLQSLASQHRPPDEVIVCDDCSTDTTCDVLAQFKRDVPFDVLIHQNKRRLGATVNFTQAFSLCRGDLLFPCDQDDVWDPKKIQTQARIMEERPEVGLVGVQSEVCDETLTPLGYTLAQSQRFTSGYRRRLNHQYAFRTMLRHAPMAGHAMAFRQSFREVISPIPPHWLHDQWIQVLISTMAGVVFLDAPLVRYRQHNTNVSGGKKKSLNEWRDANQRLTYDRYALDIERYEALLDRLKKHRCPATAITLAQSKIAFLRRRSSMHGQKFTKPFLIAKELASGNYHRLGRGWLTAGRDLLT